MDCILCGKCMEVCPLLRATAREELSPRSKMLLGTMDGEEPARLASLCLGCGRCREKCPQGVDVPAEVARLRAEHPDFHSWLWKTWLTRARELWPSTRLAAKLIPSRFQPEKLGPMLKMLDDVRRGPAVEPFVTVTQFGDALRGETVLLFSGCTANHARRHWREVAEGLLDGLGATRLSAKFECCGGSLSLAGCLDDAKRLARRNIQAWRKHGRPMLVTACASCLHSLRGYSKTFFENEREAEDWLSALFPLSSALLDCRYVLSETRPASIGYHRPCHMTGRDTDAELVKAVFGDALTVRTAMECCGFGGVMRLAEPAPADQVGQECVRVLAGAEMVLTGCSACAARLPSILSQDTAAGHWLDVFRL